jgi:heparan-alpha-glucosaminide N-acetyltransferase
VQAYGPVPDGCPTGYIGAGGLADQGLYFGLGCTGGAHRFVDVAIFGINHIYHDIGPNGTAVSAATCNDVYQCDVHDPEGALGWISAAWMAWLGLQAGRVVVAYKGLGKGTPAAFASRWLTASICLCLIGGALCGFSKNGGPIPLNKNLWSPSFVFVLSGFAFFQLTVHYFVVDVYKLWSGAPFRYVGMNSIITYFCSEVFQGYLPFTITNYSGANNHAEALAAQIVGVMSWQLFARMLYVRGIFVNV